MCTSVRVKATDDSVVVGRALEFGGPPVKGEKGAPSNLAFTPSGYAYEAWHPWDKPSGGGMQWQVRYAYCGIDYSHYSRVAPPFKDVFAQTLQDGMNEHGLSVNEQFLPGYSAFPVPKKKKKKVNNAMSVLDLVPYILGNFKRVAEVKEWVRKELRPQQVQIWQTATDQFPFHFRLDDATGDSAVLEFARDIQGVCKKALTPQWYQNPVGVLTNSPPFHWHLSNLQNYANLTPVNVWQPKAAPLTTKPLGEGSGMLGMPGDYTPPSRFVRMAMLLNNADPVESAEAAVNLSAHLLNNVDIPRGAIRPNPNNTKEQDNEADHTRWCIFKDLTHSHVYWRTYDNLILRRVDCAEVFSKITAGKIHALPLDRPAQWYVDETGAVPVTQRRPG